MEQKDSKEQLKTFDDDLEKLDKIIQKTENETDIEATIKNYKEGNNILNNLKNLLNSAEKKLNDFEKKINFEDTKIKDNNDNFLDNIGKLENIVKQMGGKINNENNANLKECVEKCEQGLKLIKTLENRLKNAEQNIENDKNVINTDENN
ncbi:MAG: exodeoxyribonuclease VII small subunit [Bacilli bacterium]|nr:exodeoxyribonuclease VII small subunit [Bacilli bacterium]